MSKKDEPPSEKMLCLPLAKNPNGDIKMLRVDESGLYTGTVKPVAEGQSIPQGRDLLALNRMGGSSWYSGEVVYSNKGPAKVNSQAYRDGWDAIFRKPEDLN